MAENVKVIVRCRPMNEKEKAMKCRNIIKVEKCVINIQNPTDLAAPSKEFTFDSVYDAKSATECVYNDICYPLVENVLEGYNGTIFAYGQTGCGKSHTMQGPDLPHDRALSSEQLAQRGIISRSFDHVFEAMSVTSGIRYLPLISYLEIYNENIRDLLSPTTSSSTLILKEQPSQGIVVQNLTSHAVHSAEECEQLLAIGTRNRMVGATLMNAGSSRSHSIFTINLEQITTSNGNTADDEISTIKQGKLNLVDLAGSERQSKTGATGDRLKEATKINLSLSALGNVISALVDGKSKHIPYRDSKLTRLLQDSLGGNTKTLMIACISPADYNYDETLSTLRYASRAKYISNRPTINEDPKDAMLREYQAEITKLKQQLEMGPPSSLSVPVDYNGDMQAFIDEEKDKLAEFYEAETTRLKMEHENQRKEKEDLIKDMENLKAHYEEKLQKLNVNNNHDVIKKIQVLKSSLVGGECANDAQLKESRKRKKLAAQHRLMELANALNSLDHTETRDILQRHYTDIQEEIKMKTEALKKETRKVLALEREVSDLQAEFQLDRTDYLETIRRLEKNLKFYQQLIEVSLPFLRKTGRCWDPEVIKSESIWNEDLNKWKLPQESMTRLKLPPAEIIKNIRDDDKEEMTNGDMQPHTFEADMYLEKLDQDQEKKLERSDSNDILGTYFRPRRAAEIIHQNKVFNTWREYPLRNKKATNWMTPTALAHNLSNNTWRTSASPSPFQLINTDGLRTTPEMLKKFPYGVHPTQNVQINGDSKKCLFQSTNFADLSNANERSTQSVRRPKAASALRDGTPVKMGPIKFNGLTSDSA